MEIRVHYALIQKGSTMLRACATTATILKEESKSLLFANTQTGWLMLEECVTVVIRRRSGKNSASLKSKVSHQIKREKANLSLEQ